MDELLTTALDSLNMANNDLLTIRNNMERGKPVFGRSLGDKVAIAYIREIQLAVAECVERLAMIQPSKETNQ